LFDESGLHPSSSITSLLQQFSMFRLAPCTITTVPRVGLMIGNSDHGGMHNRGMIA